MFKDVAERMLVRALLTLAVMMVRLFNQLDDGPVDYRVIEVPTGDAWDPTTD